MEEKEYKHFKAEIKEYGNSHILRPEYRGCVTKEEVEKFFGCHEPDVEWFKVWEVEV